VWVLGFIFTLWTWAEGTRAVLVPHNTTIVAHPRDEVKATYHLESDDFRMKPDDPNADRLVQYRHGNPESRQPPRISAKPWMGASYCVVLLIVIAITNIPLRGLWSVVVIVTVILFAVIFALAGLWDDIFHALGGLHVYIGMAGYLFISVVLAILWLISMLIFDRQIYITFEPGQMKVCEEVGSGEKSYDTMGMSIEKHRDDIFRHWVLGLGSGDLTVRTSGANSHQFTLNNVLFVSKKLQQIEQMQREKSIRLD